MNVNDMRLSPAQWLALLQRYGVNAQSLTGRAAPCPVCGGHDRFTYDNKRGRGDWICRQCADGNPMAGDGFALICRVSGLTFGELMRELGGETLRDLPISALTSDAPKPKAKVDRGYVEKRLAKMWDGAHRLHEGDIATRYLQARVPGLPSLETDALRLGMLEYWHERKLLGTWPGIVARFELPDGQLGTLHRTFLERTNPSKAKIVCGDGEILDAKKNDLTLNPLAGGAVRLMAPVDGEIGVSEGLETALAAYMEFGVPAWYCLNRVELERFVVPEGLGIRIVHIFVDFDNVDPKTGKSPGVAAGNALASRLRKEGYGAVIHRPRVRGTDFADEWAQKAALQAAQPRSDMSLLNALRCGRIGKAVAM